MAFWLFLPPPVAPLPLGVGGRRSAEGWRVVAPTKYPNRNGIHPRGHPQEPRQKRRQKATSIPLTSMGNPFSPNSSCPRGATPTQLFGGELGTLPHKSGEFGGCGTRGSASEALQEKV